MIYLYCFIICFVVPGLLGLALKNGLVPAIAMAAIFWVFSHDFHSLPFLEQIMADVWRKYLTDPSFERWLDFFMLSPWALYLIIFFGSIEVWAKKIKEESR